MVASHARHAQEAAVRARPPWLLAPVPSLARRPMRRRSVRKSRPRSEFFSADKSLADAQALARSWISPGL